MKLVSPPGVMDSMGAAVQVEGEVGVEERGCGGLREAEWWREEGEG